MENNTKLNFQYSIQLEYHSIHQLVALSAAMCMALDAKTDAVYYFPRKKHTKLY